MEEDNEEENACYGCVLGWRKTEDGTPQTEHRTPKSLLIFEDVTLIKFSDTG